MVMWEEKLLECWWTPLAARKKLQVSASASNVLFVTRLPSRNWHEVSHFLLLAERSLRGTPITVPGIGERQERTALVIWLGIFALG